MKLTLTAFLLIYFQTFSFSQSTPQDILKKFFDIYKQGNIDNAIDYLFSNNPYAKEIEEGIDNVKRQLKKSTVQSKFYGTDLLATRSAGPNIIMFTYLVRHDREPFTFNIMFYRPNDKWQMQSFKYQNETSTELEEASKAWRLKENYD